MTKAISASTRGWMKRPAGTSPPSGNSMESSRTPESGMSMWSACCMAREVSPIFQPMIRRPSASLRSTQADWTE